MRQESKGTKADLVIIDECAFCPDYKVRTSYGVETIRCCNEYCDIVRRQKDGKRIDL